MPSATVNSAFMTRLEEQWSFALAPVLGMNGVTEPPEGSAAFIVVQFPLVVGEKPVLEGHYFEDGAARIVLNVAVGTGLQAGLQMADTLASIFRTKKFHGIETFVPSAPIINDQNDDGNWFELSVIVPYRHQFDEAIE